jgi:hypothetical protein
MEMIKDKWFIYMIVGITCVIMDWVIVGALCIVWALAQSDERDDDDLNRIKRP